MKKSLVFGLALSCVASLASAQSTNISGLNASLTTSLGSCSGITGIAVNGTSSIVLTGGNCGSAGPGGVGGSVPTLSVAATPSMWTLGTTQTASASWSIANPTSGIKYSCTPSISGGTTAQFSVTADTVAANTATVTALVASPATGQYGVTVTCTGDASPLVATGFFSVQSGGGGSGGGGSPTGCNPVSNNMDTSQPSSTFPQLSRICTASYVVTSYHYPYNNVDVTKLDSFMAGGSFGAYTNEGYVNIITIPTNGYLAMAFSVPASGNMNIVTNPSWGTAGAWSVSSRPGDFSASQGAFCYMNANTMYWSGTSGFGLCTLTPGNTYYLNIAPLTKAGTKVCSTGGSACSATTLAFNIF